MKTLLAITRDTLLMLRRRRLFWLHLWVNVAIVILYASVVFHPSGWSLGFGLKEMNNPWLKQGTPWEHTMHCWIIARIMRWWVAGAAVFFVLFATAAILPETLEPGSASLMIPRARRRSLILGGRFLGAVVYVTLHAAFVVTALMLVLRWRLGLWHSDLLYGIPVAALLFMPLQAVAMLMGVLTRSATAALLVAILFAGSVWALQESAAAPDPGSGAALSEDEANGSAMPGAGWSEILAHEAVQRTAMLFPRARDSLLWLEREACPQPAPRFSYRALFRRLRIGDSGFSAVAADVIAAASVPEKKHDWVAFTPLLVSSVAFTAVIMALAAWLLKRRDL